MAAQSATRRHLVHVVGPLEGAVPAFVLPAASALELVGTRQSLIAPDDAATLQSLQALGGKLPMELYRSPGRPLARVLRMRKRLGEIDNAEPLMIYAHGVCAAFAAALLVLSHSKRVDHVWFSPHGTRAFAFFPPLRRLLLALLSQLFRGVSRRVLVNRAVEAELLLPLAGDGASRIIENPVNPALFEVQDRTGLVESGLARAPIILGGVVEPGPEVVSRFVQMGVRLGVAGFHGQLVWMGPCSDADLEQLRAANVLIADPQTFATRLQWLTAASVFVAPGSDRGYPMLLAEAMAAGLPCIAWRDDVHGQWLEGSDSTGLLSDTVHGMGHAVLQVLSKPDLRRHLGDAARHAARRRFAQSRFTRELIDSMTVSGRG